MQTHIAWALQNIAYNGLWEFYWVRADGSDGLGHTRETVTADRASTQCKKHESIFDAILGFLFSSFYFSFVFSKLAT